MGSDCRLILSCSCVAASSACRAHESHQKRADCRARQPRNQLHDLHDADLPYRQTYPARVRPLRSLSLHMSVKTDHATVVAKQAPKSQPSCCLSASPLWGGLLPWGPRAPPCLCNGRQEQGIEIVAPAGLRYAYISLLPYRLTGHQPSEAPCKPKKRPWRQHIREKQGQISKKSGRGEQVMGQLFIIVSRQSVSG